MKRYIAQPERLNPPSNYAGVGAVMVETHEKGHNRHHRPLNPRFDLRNHSPDGFAWGYHGSGPAQLAVAMLADATGDDKLALRYYQDFKTDVIALQPNKEWVMTEADVLRWLVQRQRIK